MSAGAWAVQAGSTSQLERQEIRRHDRAREGNKRDRRGFSVFGPERGECRKSFKPAGLTILATLREIRGDF